MLFQKKLDRSFEYLKEEGEKHGETLRDARKRDEHMKLEKTDIPAMIISALMVFGPIFLVLVILMLLCIR